MLPPTTIREAARNILIHNEKTKLLAAALDRASTAFLAAGVATPVAGRLFHTTIALPLGTAFATFIIFGVSAMMLHLGARALLGGLQ